MSDQTEVKNVIEDEFKSNPHSKNDGMISSRPIAVQMSDIAETNTCKSNTKTECKDFALAQDVEILYNVSRTSPKECIESRVNQELQNAYSDVESNCPMDSQRFETANLFCKTSPAEFTPTNNLKNQPETSGCKARLKLSSEKLLNLHSAASETEDTSNLVSSSLKRLSDGRFSVGLAETNSFKDVFATSSNNVTVMNQFPMNVMSTINPNPNEFDLVEENNLSDCRAKFNISNELLMDSDTSVVLSNSNAFPQSEKIVPSNYSLAQLKTYESDESLNEEPEVSQPYRETTNDIDISEKDSESDSSSTSSSTSILISDSSDSDSDDEYENFNPHVHKPIRAKKELDLDDLPPIEDLKISVPEEKCEPMGKVFQIVDQLVVVQALKESPAYNLDTILFVQGGQPLGKIFDVFGPVTEPYYCVRFNSNEQIKEKNITLNQMVYCAPKTKYTKFVFLAQLMKLKGSDASWEDDDEPPAIYLEYSDDEQEQRAKKRLSKNKKALMKSASDPDEPARKKHFAYEKRMNEKNLQLSAINNNNNSNKNRLSGFQSGPSTSRIPPRPFQVRLPPFNDDSQQIFGRLPMFNNQVPPPRMQRPPCYRQGPNSGPLPSINTPPPSFFNPGSSPHFPQMFSQHSSRGSNNNNTVNQHNFFPPPQRQGPPGFACNQGHNGRMENTDHSWIPAIPNRDSPWATSPTPPNAVPSSPFWAQRLPLTPSPNSQPPPTISAYPPSRPFWPTQSPPHSHPLRAPQFNSPIVNFNPNVPPPSPNPFNY